MNNKKQSTQPQKSTMKTANRIARLLAGITPLAALLVAASAYAASATWQGTTDAIWANTANWSVSPVPGTGDTATFNAASGFATIDLGGG